MKIEEFRLERYFAKHEFSTKYNFCASDCESFEIKEILSEEEFSNFANLRLGYSQTRGDPELRKEIARLSTNLSFEDIMVAVPQECLFIAFNALLKPRDEVIVQIPCYQSLCAVPEAIGCEVKRWSPVTINKQWHWDIELLKEKTNKKTRLIVINSSHNPTGHLFSRKEFLEIMDVARENDAYVLSDEMYRMLEYNEKDRLPIGSDVYDKCIALSGLSKTFGLGGLRIGWLTSKDRKVLDEIQSFKDYTTISNSAPSERIALAALRNKEKILSRNMKIIQHNLGLLDKFFERHNDKFSWLRPKAGPIAFVKTKFEANIEDFCEELVRKKGVLLMPGTKFDFGHHHFRMGFGRQNMPEALRLFEEHIESANLKYQ